LEEAIEHIKRIGKKIEECEIPQEIRPLIFAITGAGRCASGVLEILRNLPIKEVDADHMAALCKDPNNPDHKHNI